jgi:hypothetical protein
MATHKNGLKHAKKLETLQEQYDGTIKIESIASVVEETVNAVIEKVSAKDEEFSAELNLLAKRVIGGNSRRGTGKRGAGRKPDTIPAPATEPVPVPAPVEPPSTDEGGGNG